MLTTKETTRVYETLLMLAGMNDQLKFLWLLSAKRY